MQIYKFIDEIHNYAASSMSEILCESRKFRLGLFLSTQRVGQGMSRELTADIMANCTIKTVRKNAIETLQKMQLNIDIPLDKLKKISKYERYVHNSDTDVPARL